jgi:hypothetical protein
VKLRSVLTPVAVAAALALLLTGCETKVGAAAQVGGQRISVTDVNHEVHALSAADASAVGTTVDGQVYSSRGTVLFYLIREKLFEQTFAKLGAAPSSADLNAKHDLALQQIFQSSSANTGAEGDSDLNDAMDRIGIERSFGKDLLRTWELELVLADKVGVASDSDVAILVKKYDIKVTVSQRYGSWDAQSLNLNQRNSPAYLTLTEAGSGAAG